MLLALNNTRSANSSLFAMVNSTSVVKASIAMSASSRASSILVSAKLR